jgi:hypothetical protein
MTASKGTACGDVARTSIILGGMCAPGTPMRWLLSGCRCSCALPEGIFQLRPAEKELLPAWRAVMAAISSVM